MGEGRVDRKPEEGWRTLRKTGGVGEEGAGVENTQPGCLFLSIPGCSWATSLSPEHCPVQ